MPIIAEGTWKNKGFSGDEKNRPTRAAFYKEEGDIVIQYRVELLQTLATICTSSC